MAPPNTAATTDATCKKRARAAVAHAAGGRGGLLNPSRASEDIPLPLPGPSASVLANVRDLSATRRVHAGYSVGFGYRRW